MARPQLVLQPDAEDDLIEASRWYESQSCGLGAEFLDEVQTTFDRIQDEPDTFAKVYNDFREVTTQRFPYQVFYEFDSNRVVIYGVIHMARHASVWRRRLK